MHNSYFFFTLAENRLSKETDHPSRTNAVNQRTNQDKLYDTLLSNSTCMTIQLCCGVTALQFNSSFATAADVVEAMPCTDISFYKDHYGDNYRPNTYDIDLYGDLWGNPENVCQESLSSSLSAEGVDTSVTSCSLMSLPRRIGGTEAVYATGLRMDFTGMSEPQGIDVKPSTPLQDRPDEASDGYKQLPITEVDFALINQMIERVTAVTYPYGFLSEYHMVGATGRAGWHVWFQRNIDNFLSGGCYEVVQIRRIAHSTVLSIFGSNRQKTLQDKNWFFTSDAPHLINCLSRIVDPYACYVRLVERSMCRVYAISLPKQYMDTDANNRKISKYGPAASKYDLMLKIVDDNIQFAVESTALASVAPHYNQIMPLEESDLHYAIGFCTLNDDDVAEIVRAQLQGLALPSRDTRSGLAGLPAPPAPDGAAQVRQAAAFLRTISARDCGFVALNNQPLIDFPHVCSWRSSTVLFQTLLSSSTAGGVIVMRVGEQVDKPDIDLWLRGVSKCIRASHAVGWHQADVRERNVLKFNKNYQLIDYNLAIPRGGVTRFSPGSLYDGLGPRLHGSQFDVDIEWLDCDDWMMMAKTYGTLKSSLSV